MVLAETLLTGVTLPTELLLDLDDLFLSRSLSLVEGEANCEIADVVADATQCADAVETLVKTGGEGERDLDAEWGLDEGGVAMAWIVDGGDSTGSSGVDMFYIAHNSRLTE